jgi:hypothetical protein
METYKIVRGTDGWSISHRNKLEGSYATKEAAFEAAAAAASNAIKEGAGIVISVAPSASGEPAMGGKP